VPQPDRSAEHPSVTPSPGYAIGSVLLVCLLGSACSTSEKVVADQQSGDWSTETRPGTDLLSVPDTLPGQDVPVTDTIIAEIPGSEEFLPVACGDGVCSLGGGENCETCPADCDCTVCGNGICEVGWPLEDWILCPLDCGPCGDGICGKQESNPDYYCALDCGAACGDAVCSGSESAVRDDQQYCPVDCGVCGDGVCSFPEIFDPVLADCMKTDCGESCGNGQCDSEEDHQWCPVDCLLCGDGICGKWFGQQENCPPDCVSPCGDGMCEGGETPDGCPSDCGPCGDGVCSLPEAAYGGCTADCPPTCGDGSCDVFEDASQCPPDCGCKPLCHPEWECGGDDNGCDQPCAACPQGLSCVEHLCCIPDCKDSECGEDGCGGSCGECQGQLAHCVSGQCKCKPNCADKECGDDGCAGSCGVCGDDLFCTAEVCHEGQCLFPVVPGHCLLPDGKGGVECAEEGTENPINPCLFCHWEANPEGWTPVPTGVPCGGGDACFDGACCAVVHNCMGKQCGDNGCGGTCGQCASGQQCSNGSCIPEDCEAKCDGKECGSDGCGGQCGVCYDGLFCTVDSCDAGACSNLPDAGFCIVETVDFHGLDVTACAPDGALDPVNPCQSCDWAVGPAQWTTLINGTPCGANAVCQQGICSLDQCQPICGGKQCGADGCGGECGTCPNGADCCSGKCDGAPCSVANQWGECFGLATCGPGEIVICDANVPAQEECDGVDNNCDGDSDEEDATGCTVFYADLDGDDFGNSNDSKCLCVDGGDYTASAPGDCDESDEGVFPGAEELCNGEDDNCNVQADEDWPELGGACDGGDVDSCANGAWDCSANQLTTECVGDAPDPACAGKECGDDGCGGMCGTCSGQAICVAGLCQCQPICEGKQCGDDGCGGDCGACPLGEGCIVNHCHFTCTDAEDLFYDGCHNGWVSEYQANGTHADQQSSPSVAAFLDGSFVMAWQHLSTLPSGWDVAYRVFASDGTPATDEFILDVPLIADNRPVIVPNDDASFVLLWESHSGQAGKNGVWARHIESDGTPSVDKDLLVLSSADTNNGLVSAQPLLGGGFALSAHYEPEGGGFNDTYVRAFDASFAPKYEAAIVNSAFEVGAVASSLAVFPDHKGVVGFFYLNDNVTFPDGEGDAVFARALTADGELVGVEDFQVNDVAEGYQSYPSLAALGPDEYIAVWWDTRPGPRGTYGRVFAYPDVAQGASFMLHQNPAVGGSRPVVAGLQSGAHVVAWQSAGGGAETMEVLVRPFNAAGAPIRVEGLAHTHPEGRQMDPAVAIFGDGSFVVAYTSLPETWEDPASAQDGSGSGVFFARFTAAGSWCPVGLCNTGAAPGCVGPCDDGIPCTDDVCDPWSGQCQSIPLGGNCDDGDPCTMDTCDPVLDCQYDNKVCDDGDLCTDDSCNPVDGECLFVPKVCDDFNDCTADSCVLGVCQNQDELDLTPCGPLGGGVCQGGVCVECDDANGIPWDGCTGGQLSEFQVNDYTDMNQMAPKLAIFSDDEFGVTWSGKGPVDGNGVFFRHFNSDGTAQSASVRVNEIADGGDQTLPAIGVFGDDGYVITWSGSGAADPDGIYARRFASDGTPEASDFHVNIDKTAGIQARPDVAVLGDDRFVITWHGDDDTGEFDIFGQLFADDGQLVGEQIRVNGQTVGTQWRHETAVVDQFKVAVVWQDDSGEEDVLGRVLDFAGGPQFAGRPLHAPNAQTQEWGSVAGLQDAGFVAAWTSVAQDGDAEGVYMGRYSVEGSGGAMEATSVNTHTDWYQRNPQVAAYPDGSYVVAWSGVGPGDDEMTLGGVWTRNFTAQGTPTGEPELANLYDSGMQTVSDVQTVGSRGVVLTWTSPTQDGSFSGVFARRYTRAGASLDAGQQLEWPPPFCPGGCGDNNPCTHDYCREGNLCLNAPAVDGIICGGGGECDAGVCSGETHACDDGNADPNDGCWNKQLVEFRVNNGGSNSNHRQPAVSGFSTGEFAVSYAFEPGSGPGDWLILVHRFGADGAQEPSIPANDLAKTGQRDQPAMVSRLGPGERNYVVVWRDTDGHEAHDIFGRVLPLIGGAGTLFTGNFDFLPGNVAGPDVAASPAYDLVVTYHNTSGTLVPYGHSFSGDLVPGASNFQLDPMTESNNALATSVASLPGSRYFATWHGSTFDAQQDGIVARIFDSNQQPVSQPYLVNDYEWYNQRNPVVAATFAGNMMVAWASQNEDGDGWGIYAQRLDGAGAKFGSPIKVNDHIVGDQINPDVVALNNGHFVVVWHGAGPTDAQSAVFMQLLDANGVPEGLNMQVNRLAANQHLDVAVGSVGMSYVVVWSVFDPDEGYDVWGQKFDTHGNRIGLQ
jgi:hypothetical protein